MFGRPARPPEAKTLPLFLEMTHRIGERVSWKFGSNFTGVYCLKKFVIRLTSVEDWTNLCSWSQTADKCGCAMMYVMCAGRTDRQVTVNIKDFVDSNQISIHPPPPRCPPL